MAPPDANVRVEMRLSRVTTGRSDDHIQLRIMDCASRQAILEVNLTAQEYMDLLTNHSPGSVEGVAAWFPDTDVRQRIGKHSCHASLSWSHRGDAPKEGNPLVLNWLDHVKRTIGAHTVDTPTRHNTGLSVARFRIYLDNPGQAENWRESAQALLNNMTPPWEEQ